MYRVFFHHIVIVSEKRIYENRQIWLQDEIPFSRHFQLSTLRCRSIRPIWKKKISMRLTHTNTMEIFRGLHNINFFRQNTRFSHPVTVSVTNDLLTFYPFDLDKISYAPHRHQYTGRFTFFFFNFSRKKYSFFDSDLGHSIHPIWIVSYVARICHLRMPRLFLFFLFIKKTVGLFLETPPSPPPPLPFKSD